MLTKMITNSNSQDSSGLVTKVLPSYCRIAQIEILLITGSFEPAALNYYFQNKLRIKNYLNASMKQ